MKLKGKVAIVTGGNSGIGKGIAYAFAKEGAKVCIVGRNIERGEKVVADIKEMGSDAIFVKGDVGDKDSTINYINAAIKAFGQIDIMVNNAALIHQAKIVDLKEEDWDMIIKTNLRSVFLGSKYAAIQMIKQGKGGRIINVSSIHAKISEPSAAPYTAAKGGIESFTRTLATELAPHKITANILSTGSHLHGTYSTDVYTGSQRGSV